MVGRHGMALAEKEIGLRQSLPQNRTYATWRQLLPGHRMATVAKTPLLVAFGMYLSGGHFELQTVGVSMLLASLLWAFLYVFNESCDLTCEENYSVSAWTRIILFIIPLVISASGLLVSWQLFMLLMMMTIGQIAYCMQPFRLKRYWWVAPLLSGVVNPVLRMECGAIWGSHPVPAAAIVVLVSIHLSSAIRTRSLQRERDKRFGYLTAPQLSDKAGAFCMAVGLVGANCLCFQKVLPPYLAFATVPAIGFSAYAWSGKVKNMNQLRKGWTWFAVIALVVLLAMCFR